MAATCGELALDLGLHALAVLATAATAQADALLRIASITIPARVARARAMHAHAMSAAAVGARLVLAPFALPTVLASARAACRVARAVSIAVVHASTDSATSGSDRWISRSEHAAALALTHARDAPPAAGARSLAVLSGGARAVLALAATPSSIARALAARRIALAMVVATARARHRLLACRTGKASLAFARARRLRSAHATPIAVAGARQLDAVGSGPSRFAHAHTARLIALAMWAATLRRAATREQRRHW